MPDEDAAQGPPGRRFGGTLRLVLLYVVVVAGTLGVYFAFYVDARVEQTAVRNFRALDAASERLEEIIANLHQIAGNVPVGVASEDLDEILRNIGNAANSRRPELEKQQERIAAEIATVRSQMSAVRNQLATLSEPGAAALPPPSMDRKQRAVTSEARARSQLESLWSGYANTLKTRQLDVDRVRNQLLAGTCGESATYAALTSISDIAHQYLRDFRAIPSAAEFSVQPLSLKPADEGSDRTAQAAQPAASGDNCDVSIMTSLDNVLSTLADRCEVDAAAMTSTEASVLRRLVFGPGGAMVESRDCRPFSRRSPDLAQALPDARDAIIAVLDDYGVNVRASLAGLVGSVALNVAPLFDQYLIADAQGRVLYSADGGMLRYDGVIGAPASETSRLDFVNHVNIKELVTQDPQRLPSAVDENLSQLGLEPDGGANDGEFARFGAHSRVETFRVAGIQFQAFVHPFEVEGLEVDGLTTSNAPEMAGAPGARPGASAVLYMVGIVDSRSMSRESIRLRLSLVASALLALGVLFSLLALLWLWTGGDRLMLTSRHLALFVATGLTATLLFTLFGLHLLSGMRDHLVFDRVLERVSHGIRGDFERELGTRLGDLAEASAAMLQAGRTRARLKEADVADGIERNYYCRPDSADDRSAAAETLLSRYPSYDLAFLLDGAGTQWQCLSNRLFDTRPLDLRFREYYRRPARGRLWSATDVAGPPFFMDRVTSILDGTTETVIAAEPRALCAMHREGCPAESMPDVSAAAVIGRLRSLEDSILPPHIRFAVVENHSGRTLFHSVGSRSLATNFVRETEADEALLALMDSAHPDFVDLTYYGASVRAFAQPLTDGVPWTLITYRGHELPDTLNIIAVSATAAYVIGSLGLLLLLALLALLADRIARSRVPWWQEARDVAIDEQLIRDLLPRFIVLTATVLLLVLISVFAAPVLGGFVAVASLTAGPVVLAIVFGRRVHRARAPTLPNGTAPAADPTGHDRGTVLALLLMALLILGILPTVAWYHDFRSQLSLGLGEYLRSGSRNAVIDRCERHTAQAQRYKTGGTAAAPEGLFTFGWILAPRDAADERPEPQPGEPSECASYRDGAASLATLDRVLPPRDRDTPRGSREVLLTVSGFSPLGSDLATRGAFAGGAANASPAAVLGSLLGGLDPPPGNPSQAGVRVQDVSLTVVALLLGGLLMWLVVTSLADRVLGMRLSLGLLPPALPGRPPRSWRDTPGVPLRGCVVHRSERLWEQLLDRLLHLLRPADSVGLLTVLRARWNGEAVVWEPIDGRATSRTPTAPASTLYVVAGLERFIVDARTREALLNELERLAGTRAGILIWSRVLPGTWLATLTERVSGDLAAVTAPLALTSRWGRVLGPFDVRRLEDGGDALDQRFADLLQGIGSITVSDIQCRQVRHTMLREARANPELLELAASVVRRVCTTPESGSGNLSRLALQRFRAAAASHFHTIWAASTRGERLQLLALAKGGFVNPTQTVTLTSLANRGLIKSHGIVRMRSEAFRRFIIKDLDHHSLLRWRDHGHGNIWQSIWPPIVVVVVLAVAFFVSSTPEALGPLMAILAASIGAVPVVGSLIRGVKDLQGGQGDR